MLASHQSIDIKTLLSSVPLFNGIKPEELARLASATSEIHAIQGETLFRKNEACSGLYLLVYGRVKLVFSSAQGCEKILDILNAGSAFCEAAMLLGTNYQFYAQTLSASLLLHVSKARIMEALGNDPTFARNVIDSLSHRLFERTADIGFFSLHTGRQRVIHYLLRELSGAEKQAPWTSCADDSRPNGSFAERSESAFVIRLTTRKIDIASHLNLTQEHFSRILQELSECGLIVVDGRTIFVSDIDRLRAAADQAAGGSTTRTSQAIPRNALLPEKRSKYSPSIAAL